MLDFSQLTGQLRQFAQQSATDADALGARIERALHALTMCAPTWEGLCEEARGFRDWLVALPREAPDAAHAPPPRPTPMTVVATDGSQGFPDRHREPHCYLLNVSRVAFQYGTREEPLIESIPRLGFDRERVQDALEALMLQARPELVSALRDQLEIETLLRTAEDAAVPGRPIVALADGTLIRWMLKGGAGREAPIFEQEYAAALAGFRERGVPVASYVSMPASTEVVNLLRLARGECRGVAASIGETLEGMTDRHLFRQTLKPGERSAVFASLSHVLASYEAQDRVCFFYLHVPATRTSPSEVARVEVPMWLADEPELVDRVHAVLLSECDKGEGYPMILSEAHERAVIRSRERELFYTLIERERPHELSRKAASKRAPAA
jgi:hypothetical protein